MDNAGRDIGPDEEIPNYTDRSTHNGNPLHSNDIQEDCGVAFRPGVQTVGHVNGHNMWNGRSELRTEPLDESTEPIGAVYARVFPRGRSQMFNGTDYYKAEKRRLETFANWRFQSIIRKEDLAKDGFIYTGTGDKVLCVFCNGVLRQWEPQDTVRGEHQRNYPSCPFVNGENVGNIPEPDHSGSLRTSSACGASACGCDPSQGQYKMNPLRPCFDPSMGQTVAGNEGRTEEGESGISFSHPANPRMRQECERLQTFVDWPPQMKQKGDQLARAGFYYMGDGDKVKCFSCDALLFNWEPTDDPFVEHARFSPKCQFLLLIKGENFIQSVQSGTRIEDDVMETPAVKAVLSAGKSQESVRKGLAIFREKHGGDAVLTAADLMSIILEMEDDETSITQLPSRSVQSEDLENLQRENESLRDKQLCKICMDRDVDVIFYPCKHVVCCASCGASVTVCPICRVPINSMDKVYIT